MSASLKAALAVSLLLAANMALNVGMTYYGLNAQSGINLLRRSGFAIPQSQVLVIAGWLALGDGKWYWRSALAMPLTVGVACTDLSVFTFAPGGWMRMYGPSLDPIRDLLILHTVFASCWLSAILLATFAILLPLRRLAQWRLTWRTIPDISAPPQFTAADFLLWLAPIGGALALGRTTVSFWEGTAANAAFLYVGPLSIAPIVAVSAFAAFAKRPRVAILAAMLAITLFIGGGFALWEYHRLSALMNLPTNQGQLRWLAAHLYWQPIEELCKYIAVMLIVLTNCLVLRATGCRLGRLTRGEAGT